MNSFFADCGDLVRGTQIEWTGTITDNDGVEQTFGAGWKAWFAIAAARKPNVALLQFSYPGSGIYAVDGKLVIRITPTQSRLLPAETDLVRFLKMASPGESIVDAPITSDRFRILAGGPIESFPTN